MIVMYSPRVRRGGESKNNTVEMLYSPLCPRGPELTLTGALFLLVLVDY